MKKLLAILALLTTPALAEVPEPNFRAAGITLPCDSSFNVFEMMRKSGERLQFIGNTMVAASSNNRMYPAGLYIWMNLDTKTSQITVMFPNSNDTMCLLAIVSDFEPWNDSQPWELPKEEKQSY